MDNSSSSSELRAKRCTAQSYGRFCLSPQGLFDYPGTRDPHRPGPRADALTRLAAALDDVLTLPTGTLDRDDVDHLTRSLYALGNRLDAAKLHLLRRALEHAPGVPWWTCSRPPR